MRDVAIVAFAQAPSVRKEPERNEVEILMPVVKEVFDAVGLTKDDIGFTCSGTSDFLAGQPFSFVSALDAVGAWPPIVESHVEMDGAWALYEAWVRLQHGDVDTALVYAVGKSSMGDLLDVLCLQLDPYVLTPLWPDSISLAALQARAYLEKTGKSERDLADVAARSRANAKSNPSAQVSGDFDAAALLDEPYIASPLRKHDCPPISDGAVGCGTRRRRLARKSVRGRPAWIRGIDHRIEASLARRARSDDTPHPRNSPANEGRRQRKTGRLGRASRAVHSPGADPSFRARAGRRRHDQPIRRRTVGESRDGRRTHRIGEAAQRVISGDVKARSRACNVRSVSSAEPRVRAGG